MRNSRMPRAGPLGLLVLLHHGSGRHTHGMVATPPKESKRQRNHPCDAAHTTPADTALPVRVSVVEQRRLLNNLFLRVVGMRRDFAGVFQAADDVDDLLLHLLDAEELDRAPR